MTTPWVWFDGRLQRPGEAKVDVFDHGFLYGDSIYETLRTHSGVLFALDDHLERLEDSAQGIQLTLPWSRQQITEALEQTIAAGAGDSDVGLRLMITRGSGPLGIDPENCNEPRMLVYGWSIARGRHPRYETGVPVIVTETRRNSPEALDPRIKSGNFLNNILAFQEVKSAGAFEGILLGLDGYVAEATTSNVFWVRDGILYTPREEGILRGVTRLRVLQIVEQGGIPVEVGSFAADHLRGADEAFLTSTLKGILPISRVDSHDLPAPIPGPLTTRIADLYDAH